MSEEHVSQFRSIEGQVTAFLSTLPSGHYPVREPLRLTLPPASRQYRHPADWDDTKYQKSDREYRHEQPDNKHALLMNRMKNSLEEAVQDMGGLYRSTRPESKY
jgi:hypothetical protein